MKENNPEYDYVRVQISGTLTCKSDLHVSDGDLSVFQERNDCKGRSKNMEGSFNSVCLDHNGKPYIPGSTLRGSLTAFLDENDDIVKKLFGFEKPAIDNNLGERSAGKVRVFDAHMSKTINTDGNATPYWNEHRHTFISHGISLDDVTGTTEKGKLFRYELVPAETEFVVNLEADHLSEDEVAKLLGLLQRWQGNSESAIGKGTSKGYGRITWQHTKTYVLTKETLTNWAYDNDTNKPIYADATANISADTSLIKNQSRYEFSISIVPESPLLCNEPGFVSGVEQEAKQVFYSRSGNAVIPGTSLAGVIRAHGRKILMTLLHQADPQKKLNELANKAEEKIEKLFGSKKQQSAIEFSDATDIAETTEHPQYFNAIDRFTGGVKEGALFNVIAAQCDELKTEACYLNLNRVPEGDDWWKGLLLLIARDAIEGELAVGWGKGKGYGSFISTLTCDNLKINSWICLLNAINKKFGDDKAEKWINALLEETGNISKVRGEAA